MNMCLLEVAMCEKCRSSHFQSEREGSKKFQDWGVKKILGLGGTFAGGGWGRVSTPYPFQKSKHRKEKDKKSMVNSLEKKYSLVNCSNKGENTINIVLI